MAATDLARGRSVTSKLVSREITMFILMKEFGGLPSQWENESIKNIKMITSLLSTYNTVSNSEMERSTKGKGRSYGGGSKSILGKKYRREERIGPNGIETVDIPI